MQQPTHLQPTDYQFLQQTLLLNGCVSGLGGMFMLLFAPVVGIAMGTNSWVGHWVYQVLGGVLMVFSSLVTATAMGSTISSRVVKSIITFDAVWVLLGFVFLAIAPETITFGGQFSIAAESILVGSIAGLHFWGLRRFTIKA